MFARTFRSIFAFGVLAFAAACVEPSQPSPDRDLAVAPPQSVEVPPTLQLGPAQAVLAHFEGAFDPATGMLEIRTTPVDEALTFQVVDGPDGDLQMRRQALWCPIQTRGVPAPPQTISLGTSQSSIKSTPADCEFDGDAFPYAELGMFCADVSATSNFSAPVSNVHAQIIEITPGYQGYRYLSPDCCGTGADVSALPDGPGKPTDLFGGLWAYGDLNHGEQAWATWTFQNAGGAFTFTGAFVGTFSELCDGVDNDCDGRIDEGLGCIEDGGVCYDGTDCVGGVCSSGLCGITSMTGQQFVPVGGSATMNSDTRTLRVLVGAPAPVGSATDGTHQLRLGPSAR